MRTATSLLLFIIIIASCNKNSQSRVGRPGAYVEVLERKDTIEFINIDGTEFLYLGSAKRNSNGTPVYTSGLFTYKLKGDSILPQWMARSSIATTYYFFKMKNDKSGFTVGNFYKTDTNAERLMFEKLR